MKTTGLDQKTSFQNGLLSFVLIIGFFQLGMAQRSDNNSKEESEVATKLNSNKKNALYVTPFKGFHSDRVHFGYEYMMSDHLSINCELQLWFIDESPKEFLFNNVNDRYINNGNRFSLGARFYPNLNKRKTALYLGTSIFYGYHDILKKEASESGFFTENHNGREGEIDLVSQGFKLSIGVRRIFKSGFFMEAGLDFGRAWINKDKDTLTLFPFDKSEPEKEVEYKSLINGKFVEPMLVMGFKF